MQEPDFKGKSCALSIDDHTYSLAATGLDKVASVKIEEPFAAGVRLYRVKPTADHDVELDGSPQREGSLWRSFRDNVADTGEWASSASTWSFKRGYTHPPQQGAPLPRNARGSGAPSV